MPSLRALIKSRRSIRSNRLISASAELGFDYTLKLSNRRRTVALEVKSGEVSLRAPAGSCEHQLHDFIRARRSWVLETLAQQRRRQAEVPVRHYVSGESLRYLGRELTLTVEHMTCGRSRVELADAGFRIKLGPSRSSKTHAEQVRALLVRWYKAQAQQMLQAKTCALAAELGLELSDVKIRQTKTKWGHCTGAGVIQYNWQILCAPEAVVDYLVAHEVCHLRHHNHSARFWALVESVCPSYREQEVWLKRYGHTLVV